MIIKNILYITLLLSVNIIAQQDSSLAEFWPLHIGDTWQYKNHKGEIVDFSKIVSIDTLLSNNKLYAKIGVPPNFTSGFSYDRIDSLFRVQFYAPWAPDTCGGTAERELSVYHLGDTTGSVWCNCMDWNGFLYSPVVRFSGIHPAFIFGELRDVMTFEFGYYEPAISDFVLGPMDYLVKGIGLFTRRYLDGEYAQLTGAIINGKEYGEIVSVRETEPSMPHTTILYQNYPNPFNPTTTIEYNLEKSGDVVLRIYNILGEEIKTLVNEYQHTGSYKVIFNGDGLPSGIYCYTLRTTNINGQTKELTKLMTLVK